MGNRSAASQVVFRACSIADGCMQPRSCVTLPLRTSVEAACSLLTLSTHSCAALRETPISAQNVAAC